MSSRGKRKVLETKGHRKKRPPGGSEGQAGRRPETPDQRRERLRSLQTPQSKGTQ